MNTRITRARFLSLSAAGLLAWATPGRRAYAQGAAGSDPPEGLMKKMMEAIKGKSYEDFLIECDDTMRAALTKQMFEGVGNMMAPILQPGYKTSYLGKLRQKGHMVYLWRLEPSDSKDETLIKMSIKDRKVSGFLLQ